jgi:putative RecB family exonuclease
MSDALSYSRVDTYKKCPFKYKLLYIDKHKVEFDSVSTELGSLIHYIEEQISIDIKNGKEVNYDFYKDQFLNINQDKIIGVNLIKEKYQKDWKVQDKNGYSHEDKANIYFESGMYRLQNYLKENPNLSLYAMELPFQLDIHNKAFKGFIDRIYFDKSTGGYIIEDIKTYTKGMAGKELKQSLQMYVYTAALKVILGPDISVKCQYNLPLVNRIQDSKVDESYIKNNLDKILEKIDNGQFYPKPTPLCHWCVFSPTNPNQPAEAKNLCPYFCKWTRDNKTDEVENQWQGESMHPVILENFIKKNTEGKENL